MSAPKQNTSELVEASQLCNRFGISEATLAKWVKAGKFPAPLRLGSRKRIWLLRTVEVYIEQKAAEAAEEQNEICK